MEAINRGVGAPSASTAQQVAGIPPGGINQRVPMERIKRNYSEASYRQLELEIHNLTEQRMAGQDRKTHSGYHTDRGRELLARNAVGDAQSEFREAISLDYNNAAAHAGMARAYEQNGDTFNARAEAQTSVRLQPNVDALLVLARLNLKQNQLQAASDAVRQALQLEPGNSATQRLQQEVTAKLPASH
jgi:Tfp pilus assembly protein PilF